MKKILVFAAAALVMIACSKEDEQPFDAMQKTAGGSPVFYATTESSPSTGTKIYADEDLKVLWNEEDCISIFNMTTFNNEYIFTGEDGDNAGAFEEIPEEDFVTGNSLDHIYAVYPYASSNKISNNGQKITVSLPSEQSFKEHSFGIGANTMVAITNNYFLPFKNVCGYLKFRFYGDNIKVKSVKLEGNNEEKIAGKAYISPILGGAPTVMMDDAATTSITIKCSDPVTLGPSSTQYTEFIFVIPPTTFEGGFKVTVTDDMGATFEKSSARSLTISRNKMESMGAMKVALDYDNIFVEFEDANFKAYCVENFDTNGDGEISFNEAKMVRKISIATKNISSLKGVECFNSLTYLNYNGNYNNSSYKLSSLDISRNVLLDTLICFNNQLTSLDVSNNTALTYLNCYNNKLTSLDMTNNTELKTLHCYNNQLTSIALSNCASLTDLWCHNNQLTSLDVSSNTELQTLHCSANLLSTLDVTNNTVLNNLDCDSNQLTSLDATNNTELAYLDCCFNQLKSLDVTKSTALTYLYCNNNQLTSLNVSNNTTLTELWCHNNQLTQLNVSNNINLNTLYCYNNKLIFLDLRYNTQLTTLSAWPQEDTIYRLWKKSGQDINFKDSNGNTIVPSDFGTEIIEVD